MDTSPFHADELIAQKLAHGSVTGAGIRDQMPEQHQSFFALLPYVTLATVPADGWPVATMLAGTPGFVHATDPRTLHIDLAPELDDATVAALAAGQEIGMLGIDLATRRRNRANGRLASVDARSISVAVQQSFGNCPKYIQRREVSSSIRHSGETERLTSLDSAARAWISGSDTFFVASRSRFTSEAQGGTDISHRGGKPGFIKIDGEVLSIPDFRGNGYFNTLGNLLGDPRAALLFIDFDTGGLLQLQGEVEIDWSDAAARAFAGAQRYWRFRVRRGWRRQAALPLSWSFIEQAPTTALTGQWSSMA